MWTGAAAVKHVKTVKQSPNIEITYRGLTFTSFPLIYFDLWYGELMGRYGACVWGRLWGVSVPAVWVYGIRRGLWDCGVGSMGTSMGMLWG